MWLAANHFNMRLTAHHTAHIIGGMVRKRRRKKPAKELVLSGLGEIIRRERALLGITRDELQELSNVSLRVLASLESNEHRDPRRSTIEKLANTFQITTDELLGRTG